MAFADVGQMLEAVRPDAVVISTTAPSHCEFVCAAAAAGVRYILCEKPMASSLEECDRMIAACRAAGAKLAVNHQMRFMEQYTDIKAMIDTPEFGGLRSMVVTCEQFRSRHERFALFRGISLPDRRGRRDFLLVRSRTTCRTRGVRNMSTARANCAASRRPACG